MDVTEIAARFGIKPARTVTAEVQLMRMLDQLETDVTDPQADITDIHPRFGEHVVLMTLWSEASEANAARVDAVTWDNLPAANRCELDAIAWVWSRIPQ